MNNHDEPQMFSFECEAEILPPGTPAAPRPANRPRETGDAQPVEPAFYSFECEAEVLPPGTLAPPRPADRPRELDSVLTEADAAFARELAERVLEYIRNRPAGLAPEQLAVLVQQFLARRSA